MVLVLQAVVVHFPPAQGILKTTDLSGTDWAVAAATAMTVMIADELRKLLLKVFPDKDQAPPSSRR
jgi:Ca2+-transporting ATPase